MSKRQWAGAGVGAAAVMVLGMGVVWHPPLPAGPEVRVGPGVYRQDVTDMTLPKWAALTSVGLFGLAGALVFLDKRRGPA